MARLEGWRTTVGCGIQTERYVRPRGFKMCCLKTKPRCISYSFITSGVAHVAERRMPLPRLPGSVIAVRAPRACPHPQPQPRAALCPSQLGVWGLLPTRLRWPPTGILPFLLTQILAITYLNEPVQDPSDET